MARTRRRSVRIGVGAAGIAAGLGAVVFGLGCCSFSAPRYRGPKSDHFDGDRFTNIGGARQGNFGQTLRFLMSRDIGPWRKWTDAPPGPPPPRRVAQGAVRVTFVNHATMLIQVDGVNILTDPIWSERASLVGFAGPRRVRPPGIRWEDLPPIDVVLVSHNHYDHFDVETLKRLEDAFGPRFYAGLGNAELFAQKGIAGASELDWWQSVALDNGVRVTSVPVQHFSGRGMCDWNTTLWTGYVVHGASGAVYFAGDTGFGPHFQQVRERLGPPLVSILPIGAYRPEWFMGPIHATPDQAVEAHRILGSRISIPMHYGTFPLADDGQDEPVERLRAALDREGIGPDAFPVLGFGEGIDVAPRVEASPAQESSRR